MQSSDLLARSVWEPDWGEGTIRVIAFDEVEVVFDHCRPNESQWFMANLRSSYYSRVPTFLIEERCKFLHHEPLSAAEFGKHRPDLPLRICRSSQLRWFKSQTADMDDFRSLIRKQVPEQDISDSKIALNTSDVFLRPLGPKNGIKNGVCIKARNGKCFSSLELLWHAYNLKAPFVRDGSNGVGIYRLGIQQEIPSYYLGGAFDLAGNIESYVERTQETN